MKTLTSYYIQNLQNKIIKYKVSDKPRSEIRTLQRHYDKLLQMKQYEDETGMAIPFGKVKQALFKDMTEDERKEHIEFLTNYLNELVKHSKEAKTRVIPTNIHEGELLNQPKDYYTVKEKMDWNDVMSIENEIISISKTINKLTNE